MILLHGLLLDAHINRDMARTLAAEGYRVILLDLLGHGSSDKPTQASEHRMDRYAHQVVALLDELGLKQAVIGGVSLGANVALHVAALVPKRVKALLIEMPVMEWATPAAALLFVPMLLFVQFARPLAKVGSEMLRRLPRTGYGIIDSLMNTLSTDPLSTAAVLHGILVGPVAPDIRQRRAIKAPTLIIGHRRDFLHPLNDAEDLKKQIPGAHILYANSLLELRLCPERLMKEISKFLQQVWRRRGTA